MRTARACICFAALTAVACSANAGATPVASPTAPLSVLRPSQVEETPTQVEETPTQSDEPVIEDLDLAATVVLATADLATRLQVDAAVIELVDAQQVTWPDGSLGCPRPGEMYTQALKDGSKVILGTNGRTRIYIYHSGADGQPFLCPSAERDGGHDFVPPPGIDY